MSQQLAKAGTQATISDKDGRGGLSIALTQPRDSDARWKFSVRASTDEVTIEIGEFITCPPSNSKLSRFVAIANCPGARDWTIIANLIGGTDDKAVLSMAVGLMTSAPGLSRIAERYKQYEDVMAGTVNILAGETVVGWTAFAGAAGGTVTIGTNGAIAVPANGSATGGGAGLIEGPITITFGGDITGYFIEVAESA